jgi:hypothetical protein
VGLKLRILPVHSSTDSPFDVGFNKFNNHRIYITT